MLFGEVVAVGAKGYLRPEKHVLKNRSRFFSWCAKSLETKIGGEGGPGFHPRSVKFKEF